MEYLTDRGKLVSSKVKDLALHLTPCQTWAIPEELLTLAVAGSQTTAVQTISTHEIMGMSPLRD